MNAYDLWMKMIKAQVYTKETAIKRVTVMGPNFTDEEFESLVTTINEVYPSQ